MASEPVPLAAWLWVSEQPPAQQGAGHKHSLCCWSLVETPQGLAQMKLPALLVAGQTLSLYSAPSPWPVLLRPAQRPLSPCSSLHSAAGALAADPLN